MIRIVTAARLAGLHTDLAAADGRIRSLLDALNEQWASNLCSVLELEEDRDDADRAALEATEAADGLRQQVERMRQAFAVALLVLVRQQHRIGELEQQLAAARTPPPWLYLLRRHGEPHSLHPSQKAAKEHATACGAPRTGWGPSDLPPAEITWRVEAVAVVPEQEQRAPRSDAA
ncbi:hypothetical protein [Streptomyces sp. MST-110588]|uniref:hypothetical protein n=1 Tax=Streptomyces sp. MST-110588 TaxID=2833628 RepID=UPI001F5CBAE2|nr:hypothetical protein [Streptomyces sp. MST-110588]UNO42441.1 hypothetical protein KGS77_26585 [Streptomyces sp. MST-110588]